jgi:hypothetical protein
MNPENLLGPLSNRTCKTLAAFRKALQWRAPSKPSDSKNCKYRHRNGTCPPASLQNKEIFPWQSKLLNQIALTTQRSPKWH